MSYEQSISMPIELLQQINRNIEGIESAPKDAPSNYAAAKMPMALVWESQGENSGQIGLARTDRNFIIEVLVAPSTTKFVAANFNTTRQLLGRMLDTYMALYSDVEEYILDYGDPSGVRVQIDKSKPITDSGAEPALEVLPEVYYYGFRISIPMIVRWGSEL